MIGSESVQYVWQFSIAGYEPALQGDFNPVNVQEKRDLETTKLWVAIRL